MEPKDIISMELVMPPSIPKILVVDDDESILKLVYTLVTREGYGCDRASSIGMARQLVAKTHYDIVFLDLTLPDGSGIALLEEWPAGNGHTIVVIITGQQELNTAVQVIRKGAYDFISKPFSLALFRERLTKVVEEWHSRRRYLYYQTHLEGLVNATMNKLRHTTEQIERIYDTTVAALGAALDLRDPETEEHCHRVAGNSVFLGKALGFSPTELRNLRWGAYLHDIGKIGIPEHVLSKTGDLTAEEKELIKVHPRLGYQMIANIDFLKEATEVLLYHHEKYDGSGYPYGLKGKDIPLAARIFAVTDSLDAMTYDRPYREALPFADFVAELKRESGRHFDPVIVEKFLQFPRTTWQVQGKRQKEKQRRRIVDARS